MPLYQVWIEGWSDMDQRTPAEFLGEVRAPSFSEATREICQRNGLKRKVIYDKTYHWYEVSGSRLWDNETDARRRFG